MFGLQFQCLFVGEGGLRGAGEGFAEVGQFLRYFAVGGGGAILNQSLGFSDRFLRIGDRSASFLAR